MPVEGKPPVAASGMDVAAADRSEASTCAVRPSLTLSSAVAAPSVSSSEKVSASTRTSPLRSEARSNTSKTSRGSSRSATGSNVEASGSVSVRVPVPGHHSASTVPLVTATVVGRTPAGVSTRGTPATRITGTMRAPGESAVDQSMRAVVMRQALVSVGVADGATRPRSHSQ